MTQTALGETEPIFQSETKKVLRFPGLHLRISRNKHDEGSVQRYPTGKMRLLTILKGSFRVSIFPVKLIVIYVLLFTFLTGLFDGPFDPGSPYPEDEASQFSIMVALSPALLIAVLLCFWNFRRMPIFAIVACTFALWLAWQIWEAYWPGFDTDFPNSFDPIGFFCAALVISMPFLVAYLVWFFLQRKKLRALQACDCPPNNL